MTTLSTLWMASAETSEAEAIVSAWAGTEPMRSEDDVRRALEALASGGDIALADVERILPEVCAEARRVGLLVPLVAALHSCSYCGRHPRSHAPGGENACGACGLGDDVEADP